jgi:UDP-2,3-diacylglucosamine pyrophosphatase LpxH
MYDMVFISDTHLGSHFSKTTLLGKFLNELKTNAPKKLFLVGDIFDVWKSNINVPDFTDYFQGFPKIIYLLGNHDSLMKNLTFVSSCIKERAAFSYESKNFLICHGHVLDSDYGNVSMFNFLTDKFFYEFSKLINIDIRSKLHFLTEWYYEKHFPEKEAKIREMELDSLFDFFITGHTHCPGMQEVGSLKIFNLGSWLQTPYAFFLKEGKYAFIEITESKLQPEEKDFNSFR